jgi:hypothetical protein
LTRPVLLNPTLSGRIFATTVDTLAGRTYFLERSRSLESGSWILVDQILGSGGPMTLSDLNPIGSESFYRARAQ